MIVQLCFQIFSKCVEASTENAVIGKTGTENTGIEKTVTEKAVIEKANAGSANTNAANAGTTNAGTANASTANAGTANAGTANNGTETEKVGTENVGVENVGTENAGNGESIDYMIDETLYECKEEYEKIKEVFLRQYSKDLNNPMIHTFDKCMIEQLNRETSAKYVMCVQLLQWNYKKCEKLMKQNVIDLIYLLKPMSDKLKYYY